MLHHRIAIAFSIAFAVVAFGIGGIARAEDPLQNLPPGVFLLNRGDISPEQREAIGRRLGGGIQEMTNSLLQIHGQRLQVNLMTADSDASADAIYASISKLKAAPFCIRHDRLVVEYVGDNLDAAFATKASYELKIVPKPHHVRYRVTASLATIDHAEYMLCNLFSKRLQALQAQNDPLLLDEVGTLMKRFQFGRILVLREPKLGEHQAVYQFEPKSTNVEERSGVCRYSFADLPLFHGIPYVKATLEISADDTGLYNSTAKPEPNDASATKFWPAEDAKIVALAKEITRNAQTDDAKVEAILSWLAPGTNLRYMGETGSRWGTLTVIGQKYGYCWDFSDCFITLCRAVGVPCRQVAGWLFGTSGHVWAEYYREGKGWQQVDPTGGGVLPCGIYHIPYFTSEDGEMPIVYLSLPKIEVIEQE